VPLPNPLQLRLTPNETGRNNRGNCHDYEKRPQAKSWQLHAQILTDGRGELPANGLDYCFRALSWLLIKATMAVRVFWLRFGQASTTDCNSGASAALFAAPSA
jgi:hypothetical protein